MTTPKKGNYKGSKPKFSDESFRELLDMGLSVGEIATRIGCDRRTVTRAKKRLDYEMLNRGGPNLTQEARQKIRSLSDEGWPASEIAEELGIHVETATKYGNRTAGREWVNVLNWARLTYPKLYQELWGR